MSTMASEVRLIARICEVGNRPLTADEVVEAAKDENKYPLLHDHLWKTSEETLLKEARRQRAHVLIVQLRIVSQDGDRIRLFAHARGTPGYIRTEEMAANVDLAPIKLNQLAKDLRAARERFSAFRRMIDPDVAGEIEGMIDAAASAAEKAANRDNEDRAQAS